MRKTLFSLGTALALAACLTAAYAAADKDQKPLAIGAPAPAFSLENYDGKTVSLADHKGKTVVLEWINKDCPFVVRHHKAKTMETLAQKYKDKDVVWIAINSTKNTNNETNKETATLFSLSYPVLNDASGKTGHAYDAKTTPHMYIIDKDGNLAYRGAIDSDPTGKEANPTNYVAAALDELLAGKSVSTPETKPYGCSVKYAK